jgi:RND family efflux transporter MFP subunit
MLAQLLHSDTMRMNQPFPFLTLAVVIALSVLWGCSGKADEPVAAKAGSAPAAANAPPASGPPVTVSTVRAQKRDMPVLLKTTGTVTALASVDVRAQMSSMVSKVHIQDGQFVKKGDLLFTLDARADEANVAKARAQLAKDAAALADAQRQLARAQQLLAQNFISQGALDTSRALVDSQTAVVAADQAAIEGARVALSNARVVAQTAGRAGAVSVSAGSAVQANVTSLVTITQLDPISVAFSLPQRNLNAALGGLKAGGVPVTAVLPNGGGSFTGKLNFVDSMVDANSGSIKVKALFDNRDSKLWPGSFVEVSQTASILKDAVVIPQASIIQSARGTMVYVMVQGKAVLKPVKLVYAQGLDAAVTGIEADEQVVMEGKQNLKPGVSLVERAERAKGAGADATAAKRPAKP